MKITGGQHYYALLCDTSKYEPKYVSKKYPPLICGVFASRKEARACEKEIKDCPAVHRIVKCSVTIDYASYKKVHPKKAKRTA